MSIKPSGDDVQKQTEAMLTQAALDTAQRQSTTRAKEKREEDIIIQKENNPLSPATQPSQKPTLPPSSPPSSFSSEDGNIAVLALAIALLIFKTNTENWLSQYQANIQNANESLAASQAAAANVKEAYHQEAYQITREAIKAAVIGGGALVIGALAGGSSLFKDASALWKADKDVSAAVLPKDSELSITKKAEEYTGSLKTMNEELDNDELFQEAGRCIADPAEQPELLSQPENQTKLMNTLNRLRTKAESIQSKAKSSCNALNQAKKESESEKFGEGANGLQGKAKDLLDKIKAKQDWLTENYSSAGGHTPKSGPGNPNLEFKPTPLKGGSAMEYAKVAAKAGKALLDSAGPSQILLGLPTVALDTQKSQSKGKEAEFQAGAKQQEGISSFMGTSASRSLENAQTFIQQNPSVIQMLNEIFSSYTNAISSLARSTV